MTFSVDKAYLEYFKCSAEGSYDQGFLDDRLTVTAMGAGTAAAGAFRVLGRVIHVVIEVAKVAFYTLATIFTLGAYGNGKRLLDHCKLLCLDLAALIAQPLQVTIHLLATVAGLISPMVGYRLMQGGTAPLALITGAEKKIWQEYQTPEIYVKATGHITDKLTNLFEYRTLTWAIAATIFNEFSAALEGGLLAPLGYMKRFHLYGSNPTALTDKQKQLTPILVLNGNQSHQGTFLPLMHALKQSGNERPVYSFTLYNSDGPRTIENKIEAIRKQYGLENGSFKIDLIGHSMGARFTDYLLSGQPEYKLVRRAITIGTPFWTTPKNCEPFDIVGKQDIVIPDTSSLDQEHQATIDAGHLGLLSHPETLKAVIRFLGNGQRTLQS